MVDAERPSGKGRAMAEYRSLTVSRFVGTLNVPMQLYAVPTLHSDPRLAVSVGGGLELILILPR